MKISLTITSFLMLSLLVQGFMLSGLLLSSSKKINSNKWISALIFVISIEGLLPNLGKLGIIAHDPWLLTILFPLKFALGPLIYFYTRSLVFGDEHLSAKKYLHFLPMLFDMKYQVIYLLYITHILYIPFVQNFYFLPATQRFLFGDGVFNVIAAFISMSIYSVVSYRIARGSFSGNSLSSYKLADMQWLKKLIYVIFGLIVIWLISIIVTLNLPFLARFWNYYLLFIPSIAFVYWLGLSAYLRQNKMTALDVVEYNKSIKVYFTDAEAHKYQQQLMLAMEAENLYLNPLLKLDDLAGYLSISERAFSNLLNRHVGKNFNDFVNEYRVREAIKKLADPALRQFTIAAIAFDCGFNSLATFQRCFKQFTGTTPSQYQNSLKPV